MKRESFRSRLGFLLVSAGCAIGIGNVWRFPYVTGKNGGGYFVLFYILCLLIMGVPVLTMELAVGRASRKSADPRLQDARKAQVQKWHIHGWFCLIGCYLLDDVLHDGFRLDGELLRQVPDRQVLLPAWPRGGSRPPCSASCCPIQSKWRILDSR